MTETESTGPVVRFSTTPSGRRFYLWQIAKWVTFVHMLMVTCLFCITVGMMHPLGFVIMLPVIVLAPLAISACDRLSRRQDAWRWILPYWLLLIAPFGHVMYLTLGMISMKGPYIDVMFSLVAGIAASVIAFLPLFATLLAAVLTIGARGEGYVTEGDS